MDTYKRWRQKYSKVLHPSSWLIISRGLSSLYPATGDIEKGSRLFDADTDMDEYLSPEVVLSGYMNLYVDTFGYDIDTFANPIRENTYRDYDQAVNLLQVFRAKSFDTDDYFNRIMKLYDVGESIKKQIWLGQFSDIEYAQEKQSVYYSSMFDMPEKIAGRTSNKDYVESLKSKLANSMKDGTVIYADELLNLTYEFLMQEAEKKTSSDTGNIVKPAEDFTKMAEEYNKFQKKLLEKIMGQDVAVRRFVQGIFGGKLKRKEQADGPEATFLFVGPPGVGKTYLAETAAKISNRPYRVFHMSEYASHESFNGLVGFESTYKNSQEGVLTKYVSENPNAILLFDEIEKAHIKTIHLFLSVLEGGVLKDLNMDKDVDFSKTIVIFTTNAGRGFFEDKRDINLSMIPEETLADALRRDLDQNGEPKMPPEILSRLRKGQIIGFNHMDPVKLVPLIRRGLAEGAATVRETFGFDCEYDSSLLTYIFLYYMGANLDARVANARSISFIKDAVLKMMERIGESPDGYVQAVNGETIKAGLQIDIQKDKLVENLVTMKTRPVAVIVCSKAKRANFPTDMGMLEPIFVHADENDFGYREDIEFLLRTKHISAVFVDPFLKDYVYKNTVKIASICDRDTKGMEVLEWLLNKEDHPDIYCMEFGDDHIEYADRQLLSEKKVKGFLELGGRMTASQREEAVYSVCYEQFLSKKLEYLLSKGKRLNYEMGHHFRKKATGTEIKLCLYDFRLERSMDTEAREIFIDDGEANRDCFDDVVGGESAKEELRRYINYIKNPEEYVKSGQQISKGILLYGPSGTGKTKLARALASEAECPFISVAGPEFVNGKKRITDVFRLARKYAPSIVFIDEIEAFAIAGKNTVRYTDIVKELLTEMDGFVKNKKPVFVIAATNAASAPGLGEKNIYLDEPLLRRFTKKVYMKWPTRDERIKYVEKEKEKYRNKQFNLNALGSEDIHDFADMTAGHSLAEMENVIELAIGRAAERNSSVDIGLITACFEESIYGEEQKYSKDHIYSTAIHEAGHAFMGFFCEDFRSGRFLPEYATIIARGGYLGMVRQKDDENRSGYSKEELLKLVRIKLAGRAAEIVFNPEKNGGMTTGAANDFESATNIVINLLTRYGMEEGFMVSLPMEMIMKSSLAEKYVNRIDEILSKEMEFTIKAIRANEGKVKRLADELMDKSRLGMEEMAEILNAEIEERDRKEQEI